MPVIIVDAVTKEPREYKGRKKWGVKPQGWSEWINMYCDFRPSKGQSFSVNITETLGKPGTASEGRIFKDAEIIGPAPGVPPPPPPQTPSVEAQFNQIKQQASGKISWDDWALVIRTTWDIVTDTNMPPAEGVALVNTTLIAYSNGKLETPVFPVIDDDGVVGANSEVKEDDIPW